MTNSSTVSLVILHTNDLHSVFEAMPRISTMFQAYEQSVPPERLLRFDIGDHMDRMRPETEGTLGRANADVMNATGYDAAVPGNNEGLTLTADMLEELYGRRLTFPIVATNLRKVSAGSTDGSLLSPSWNRSHAVFERSGIRIGVVGLTAPFNDFYKELGWLAEDPIGSAREEIMLLREKEAVDIVIVLSHLGFRADQRLASEVPGIDLILGGHTHHLLEEVLLVDGTYLAAAGKFGTHVGVVHMEIDKDSRCMIGCTGGAVDLSGTPSDPRMTALIAACTEDAKGSLRRTVANIEEGLPFAHDRESTLGNLLASEVRRHCSADIGIVNTGQLLAGLEAGPLTEGKLLSICPSPVNPCAITIQGDHIVQAIEESLLEENIHKPIRGFGFRGNALGALCLDGLTVLVNPDGAPGSKVTRVLIGGEPLNLQANYRVGTLDMFTFGIGYLSLSKGFDKKYYLPEFIRDLLGKVLSGPDQELRIAEAKQERYRCVPF